MVRLRDPGSLDLRLQLTRLSILDWLEEDVNVNASFSIHIFYLLYLYIYILFTSLAHVEPRDEGERILNFFGWPPASIKQFVQSSSIFTKTTSCSQSNDILQKCDKQLLVKGNRGVPLRG